MKKKLLSLALVLVMALTLLPMTALAAGDFDVQNGVLMKYNGKAANVTVPTSVTVIGESAFVSNQYITSVTIPEGVTTIENCAFELCPKLTTVKLPSTLCTIGEGAFGRCPITSINFPSGLESIGDWAFQYAKITSLSLPDSVKSIGEGAFKNVPLKSASLPGVTTIGIDAFKGCNELETVSFPSLVSMGVEAFYSSEKIKALTIPASLAEVGNNAMPPNVETLTVSEGAGEFKCGWARSKYIHTIQLPSTLKVIGENAFSYTSIEEIVLPDGLQTIEQYAFYATKLRSIWIPASVSQMGNLPFSSCDTLEYVVYEDGVTGKLEYNIFASKAMKAVYLPASLTKIETSVFSQNPEFINQFTVYTPEGSTAASLAIEYGFPVVYTDDGPPENVFGRKPTLASQGTQPTPPPTPTPPALTARPTSSTVLVNGSNVAFDAYNIGGNNYFKLRDLAYILSGTEKQFDVGWDGVNNAISLTSGKAYTAVGGEMEGKGTGDKTPTATTSKIYLDGKQVTFTAYNIEGNNYFKLRDVGQAFDFNVSWDGANNTIVIATNESYTAD